MTRVAEGPHFEDLSRGQVFEAASGVTLTEGLAAAHQAIVGNRLRLSLDKELSSRVCGADAALASPALVWDVSIGGSTIVTHHVKANLFYRGLAFHRAPRLGDTLYTTTEVVGLKENARREGRRPTGLVALRISTVDQQDRTVLDFWRCAMLPLRDAGVRTGHADDLSRIGADPAVPPSLTERWDLSQVRRSTGELAVGDAWEVRTGDVVTSAPGLARLTLNIAATHHDFREAGERLVYGGHVIGLALAQVARALPDLVTVTAWEGCDHLGPVREGDTIWSNVTVTGVRPLAQGRLVDLQAEAFSHGAAEPVKVLDWRFSAVLP
ncbi:acyl dehydratase [Nocardioides sp. zg-579]|uniref:Acyl dehydratase n=1 Tax=Nocardioides marmotae TaxID=2663857 RepID=A0A6I3J8W3_9ACTN|nr:MaoC family dehydratase [Nocardioides marmotae]MCR6030079.1 acyl dehydratase [Gordonia jinghuaiqii]MTB93710.1 acyl dehydratase [Nocardioides marmotae]QKE00055.1 acyl dehydratase [Nocardioides marmotae]